MPEVGDTVFMIFPTDDESDAHASSSMRQSATGKAGDPLVKFLRTPFGKEVKLNNKEVLITGKDDETYVRINEDTGVNIYTLKPANIFTDETLNINSTGKMTIHSVDDMNIITDANLTIIAKDSIHLECGEGGENIVHITPSEGISAATTTEINSSSTGKTNIQSIDDMNIVTDANFTVKAKDSIHLESGGGGESIVHITPSEGINASTDAEINLYSTGKTSIQCVAEMGINSNSDLSIVSDSQLIQSGAVCQGGFFTTPINCCFLANEN